MRGIDQTGELLQQKFVVLFTPFVIEAGQCQQVSETHLSWIC